MTVYILVGLAAFILGFVLGYFCRKPVKDGYLDVIETNEGTALMLEIDSMDVIKKPKVSLEVRSQ